MFTLAFLLIVIAATAYSAIAAAHRPLEPVEAIPVGVLGLTWRRLGDRRTGTGPKSLWIGDGDAAAFSAAYSADKEALRAVGFSWGGEIIGCYDRPAFWEPVPAPNDSFVLDAVAKATDAAVARAHEEEACRAAAEVERIAREDAPEGRGSVNREVVAKLRDRMARYPWAWTRSQRDTAAKIFAQGDRPSTNMADKAAWMVWNVDDLIRRVTEKVQTVRVEGYWRLAADPQVQLDVHAATKDLSGLDADMATIENREGWSRAHTHVGHVLSALPALGQVEAAHALRAVYPHRGQLWPELRLRLFGEV